MTTTTAPRQQAPRAIALALEGTRHYAGAVRSMLLLVVGLGVLVAISITIGSIDPASGPGPHAPGAPDIARPLT